MCAFGSQQLYAWHTHNSCSSHTAHCSLPLHPRSPPIPAPPATAATTDGSSPSHPSSLRQPSQPPLPHFTGHPGPNNPTLLKPSQPHGPQSTAFPASHPDRPPTAKPPTSDSQGRGSNRRTSSSRDGRSCADGPSVPSLLPPPLPPRLLPLLSPPPLPLTLAAAPAGTAAVPTWHSLLSGPASVATSHCSGSIARCAKQLSSSIYTHPPTPRPCSALGPSLLPPLVLAAWPPLPSCAAAPPPAAATQALPLRAGTSCGCCAPATARMRCMQAFRHTTKPRGG